MPARKVPEKMSKDELATAISKKLTKDELVALYKGVQHGYRPFAVSDTQIELRHPASAAHVATPPIH